MRSYLFLSCIIVLISAFGCSSTKSKQSNNLMELTITDIRNEKDGQTLFLSDDKGGEYTTIISIPNGNYVEVKEGDRISLVAKEILEMHPAQIISENIVVLGESHLILSTLKTDKTNYKSGEPIQLTMTMKNKGNKPFTFLPWGTPIENSFTGDCLSVKDAAGNVVNYSGIMVKRMPPTDKDYVTLKTGESTSGTANLLDGYKPTKPGKYTFILKKISRSSSL